MDWIRGRLHLLAALLILTSCAADPAGPPASSAGPRSSSVSGYPGELPPLPRVKFASARPEPLTRAAYEFAARHPEVLRHMPCFCGCERNGHGNNEDCFITRRQADGRPEWSPHGIGCGICIDIAREAERMFTAGSTVAQIRSAIDLKYRAEYPTSTSTPPVHD
jgi:hypothetical protein